MTYEEKIRFFEKELNLIFNESIREFTKLCLISAPDYIFEDCPASSTGKFHPIDELAGDGNIVHIKKVITLAYELCKGLQCEDRRDEILAACLIHDLLKQGKEKSGWTQKIHPQLAAELVDEIQNATQLLPEDSYQIIRSAVGYHYGPWGEKEWLKPVQEYTKEELCVYIADFVSSKRPVSINYRR